MIFESPKFALFYVKIPAKIRNWPGPELKPRFSAGILAISESRLVPD